MAPRQGGKWHQRAEASLRGKMATLKGGRRLAGSNGSAARNKHCRRLTWRPRHRLGLLAGDGGKRPLQRTSFDRYWLLWQLSSPLCQAAAWLSQHLAYRPLRPAATRPMASVEALNVTASRRPHAGEPGEPSGRRAPRRPVICRPRLARRDDLARQPGQSVAAAMAKRPGRRAINHNRLKLKPFNTISIAAQHSKAETHTARNRRRR